MKHEDLIARWEQRLADNISSAKYYAQFAGERLGTFAQLKELDRERERIYRRLEELKSKGEAA